jgi:hypothetical protein
LAIEIGLGFGSCNLGFNAKKPQHEMCGVRLLRVGDDGNEGVGKYKSLNLN